jgi:hypothetical protein
MTSSEGVNKHILKEEEEEDHPCKQDKNDRIQKRKRDRERDFFSFQTMKCIGSLSKLKGELSDASNEKNVFSSQKENLPSFSASRGKQNGVDNPVHEQNERV